MNRSGGRREEGRRCVFPGYEQDSLAHRNHPEYGQWTIQTRPADTHQVRMREVGTIALVEWVGDLLMDLRHAQEKGVRRLQQAQESDLRPGACC
ncbi:MAG: hypothetical protein ABW047_07860 [Nitrospiraceae bacterium]